MIPLPTMSRGSSPLLVLPLLCTMNLSGACGSPDMGPAVAIPELGFNRARVPIGGPLEMTYRFTASPEIGTLTEPYRVSVQFLDADGELMFIDDHDPPVATTDWRPGETVTYERRMFIPMYPYVGNASIGHRRPSRAGRRSHRPGSLCGGDDRVGAPAEEHPDVPGRLASARA